MKIIEYKNPFAPGGVAKLPLIRETNTQYICKNDIRYRKPREEVDGCSVKQVCADRLDMPATLRIKED